MRLHLPHWISPTTFEGIDHPGDLWIDAQPNDVNLAADGVKIYALVEPRAARPTLYTWVEQNITAFTLVFTFDEHLLRTYPNTRQLLFGTSWVNPAAVKTAPVKSGVKGCHISFLCGGKLVTTGHKIRRTIYNYQNRLDTATRKRMLVYRSSYGGTLPPISPRGNPFLPDTTKESLHSPFQYSIVIENSNEANYFSEKLIDCLLCRTIPIYWGCSNIDTFFNPRGLLRLKGSDPNDIMRQLDEMLPSCDAARYSALAAAVQENYEKALAWAAPPYAERLVAAIRENLGGLG